MSRVHYLKQLQIKMLKLVYDRNQGIPDVSVHGFYNENSVGFFGTGFLNLYLKFWTCTVIIKSPFSMIGLRENEYKNSSRIYFSLVLSRIFARDIGKIFSKERL